jgi:hypothetical protein
VAILRKVAYAIEAAPIELDIHTKARIAALTSEMHAIHSANTLYWRSPDAATLQARAEHEFRKERLEKIRNELAQLQRILPGIPARKPRSPACSSSGEGSRTLCNPRRLLNRRLLNQ